MFRQEDDIDHLSGTARVGDDPALNIQTIAWRTAARIGTLAKQGKS